MPLTTRLSLGQAQTMTVTPQLLQSIRLLQLTHLELTQFIDEQIQQNPLLERADAQAEIVTDETEKPEPGQARVDQQDDIGTMSSASLRDTFDARMDNVFPDDHARLSHPSRPERNMSLPHSGYDGRDSDFEDYIAGHVSLRDHVLEQVAFLAVDPAERLIASELIEALDERGYVDVDIVKLAERLSVTEPCIVAVLTKLQECEPAGLFARSLQECLALQCSRANRLDPAMKTLLDNLDLLAKRDFKALKQLCGVEEADLLDMMQEIQRLDPHPGSAFEVSGSQTVVHDVSVTAQGDDWQVELNADVLPKVLVNRDYYATLSRAVTSPSEKSFVADCYADASWLERSLEQRAQTILKVATEIVKQQGAFFAEGVRALKPMTMKVVADAIGMHESTISRVASNKYMLTPRGLFELRFFFTVALPASNDAGSDEAHSSQAVRQRIRDLIGAETVSSVLSDDALVDRLNADGIDIARRTVAKYRESMGIASSVQRRREMKARRLAAE